MNPDISITAIASVSPLGASTETIWQAYLNSQHCFSAKNFKKFEALTASLPEGSKKDVENLKLENSHYKNLDNSVLYAILASRKAVQQAGWQKENGFGVNLGSSRGATRLFETYYEGFLATSKTETLTSPTTTLGNISSWVAHDLQTRGPQISHSITCSTALHALLNGCAWLNSGMAEKFLVGGSEAPLTPFTISQMQAMKIYTNSTQESLRGYPCQALNLKKTANTMVLGEGAAVACLEKGKKKGALAYLEGVGYATELLEHSVSISSDARCFQESMKMALAGTPLNEVDVIVMHAPGTVKGDLAEVNAVQAVFGKNAPALTTNKWKIGHTFGASGMLSIEMATLMMQRQQFIGVPFINYPKTPDKINKVLVNAVGFGGNAVSVLLRKPEN